MNRYFFNFRDGDEVALDQVGMYLPNLDAAREVALRTCHDLETFGASGQLDHCAVEIANATGERVLTVPCDDALS